MKKILLSLFTVSVVAFAACNNDTEAKDDAKSEKKEGTEQTQPAMAAEKDHVCTDKCQDGNHFYAHGEKGHVCSEECMKEHKM